MRGDGIDLFYRLQIGEEIALTPDGHQWNQAHQCQHRAHRCPPMGVDVEIREVDEHGLLDDVAVGRMIAQTWEPRGRYVFCTLRVMPSPTSNVTNWELPGNR